MSLPIKTSLSEDWERSETEFGVPFYINHKTERTFWNHPIIMKLERKVASFNKIKYAAYRTAMKLRAIQKATCGCTLGLSSIKEYFENNGMQHSLELKEVVTAAELKEILNELFLYEIKASGKVTTDSRLASELMLNWILNVHDNSRTGTMRFLSVKLALVIVCSGSPREKYNYMFSQLQTQQGTINRERIGFFLQACLKIPKYLNEERAFGQASIEPAIKHFFQQAADSDIGFSSDFVEWMLAEPQPLVWIPTLYRLAASEKVKHEAKCNVCKLFPLVGFRYKCLQCFNFDICQECFWTGRSSKSHKLEHPTQEYCMPSSQTNDLKDVKKMFKNKLFKGKKNKKNQSSKKRYTEVQPDQQSIKSGGKDYEGIEESENGQDSFSEPLNYQVASEYEEEAPEFIQNSKSVEEIDRENTWDPEVQPLQRPQNIESLPSSSINDEPTSNYNVLEEIPATTKEPSLRPDQKLELDKIIASLEEDNREFQDQTDAIRDTQLQEEREQSFLSNENARLRLERRRMGERQTILEEHNRLLEMEMQKLRLLLQQQKDDMLTMIDIKESQRVRNIEEHVIPARPIRRREDNYRPARASTVVSVSNTRSNSRLRIPTGISIKNSKIVPMYDTIPEIFVPPRPITRQIAWESRTPEIEDNRHDHGFNLQQEVLLRSVPLYEEVRENRNFGQNRSGHMNAGFSQSQEEQELDRTVKWAMDNFRFSETESNC